MIRRHFAQIAAVLTLFLVLGAVLSYLLLLGRSTAKHVKETRDFRATVDSCESADLRAKADHQRGVFKMYFTSGLEMREDEFPYTFHRRLERDFNIVVIYTGDVGYPYFSCYNLKMDSLLSEKIGHNTIESLYRKMHSEQYLK